MSERGQVLPLALGAVTVLVVLVAGLGALGAAIVAKGRAQRAADLIALSAAGVLDEERWRTALAKTLPDGRRNPQWISHPRLAELARAGALEAARRNDIPAGAVSVRLIAYREWAPSRVRVELRPNAVAGGHELGEVALSATAEAVPEGTAPASAIASGGGYSGPLAIRQGEGMRPDVAAAFDRMAAAASRAGHPLAVTSAFRSDAEQAILFAQNPDPKWVAPPGRSLHRCATELDLGPASAHGWLAENAPRFGFVKRYAHEPWHYGYARGAGPCAPALGRRRAGDRTAAAGLPAWVPAPYRGAILRAAARNGVSAALLTAQLSAESGFDPSAVSPAGAQGIAQFMPATAASVGLADPFDPQQAIAAQGRLMGELIRQFGSPTLALAAYNAGPGAVAACNCVPPYPETRAYLAQISALLAGHGLATSSWRPAASVRLVA